MTSTIARPDRGITAPGPLLHLTAPARAALDFGLLTTSAPLFAALPRGDGHPVLVLPRLGATDSSTITLRAVLRRLGYRTYRWRLGRNIGPTQRAVHGRRARLDQLTTRFGQPVSLIGWSLGGNYARQLARRTVHAVRQVITLGSPIRLAQRPEPRQSPDRRLLSLAHRDLGPASRTRGRPTAGAHDPDLLTAGRHRRVADVLERAGAPSRDHRCQRQPPRLRPSPRGDLGDRRLPGAAR